MKSVYYSNFKENACMRTFFLVLSLVLFSFFPLLPVNAETASENIEIYRMKGLEAQNQGSLDEAVAYFSKAISLNPNRPDLYNDLGVVYEAQGNAYQAKRYYYEAITLDKKYLPAYSNLALLCQRQGNLAKAIEFFKKRIELGDPSDPWTKDAVEHLRTLSQAFPQE